MLSDNEVVQRWRGIMCLSVRPPIAQLEDEGLHCDMLSAIVNLSNVPETRVIDLFRQSNCLTITLS